MWCAFASYWFYKFPKVRPYPLALAIAEADSPRRLSTTPALCCSSLDADLCSSSNGFTMRCRRLRQITRTVVTTALRCASVSGPLAESDELVADSTLDYRLHPRINVYFHCHFGRFPTLHLAHAGTEKASAANRRRDFCAVELQHAPAVERKATDHSL